MALFSSNSLIREGGLRAGANIIPNLKLRWHCAFVISQSYISQIRVKLLLQEIKREIELHFKQLDVQLTSVQ